MTNTYHTCTEASYSHKAYALRRRDETNYGVHLFSLSRSPRNAPVIPPCRPLVPRWVPPRSGASVGSVPSRASAAFRQRLLVRAQHAAMCLAAHAIPTRNAARKKKKAKGHKGKRQPAVGVHILKMHGMEEESVGGDTPRSARGVR